jgi:ATP synthase protein I|tara:strand:+ start:694 stop:1002 length:309 start_codon:yes stop_codon:yes gene_type:complete
MTDDKTPSPPPSSAEDDPLVRETRLRRDRRARWRNEGDMSIGRRLAQIGVLGWIIVIPTLAGLYAGHWIDARNGTGVFWTGAFLFVGLAVGGWTAWKWMNTR